MTPAPVAIAGARPLAAPLAEALGAELVAAAKLLNDLAYDLASDDAVLRSHMGSLQAIDRVTQVQLCVADLLREWDQAPDLLASVPLEEMGRRLRAATGTS